jgi:hypothetical protein
MKSWIAILNSKNAAVSIPDGAVACLITMVCRPERTSRNWRTDTTISVRRRFFP